ncbi:MAG: OmpA family protein [Betaproteobacteria bacterium]|nr:MAG: OmpA family protein [Betaproteobacteria bacterium]
MQRKANRLLLLLIGTALAACQATTEQGTSGTEEEFYDIPPSTVDTPPPEPEPIQYTEAELDVGDLGPIDYAEETVTYEEETFGTDTGVSEPEEYYDYTTDTIEYEEEFLADSGTGVSAPTETAVEAPQEVMEFPVTTYEMTEEPEVEDLGAIEQSTETLSYAEEYVPDEGTGVSEPEEYVMEEEVPELGPVAAAEETLSFDEEPLYQEESVGDVTTYESVTVNAEAQPLFEFDRSEVQMDEQWKLEGFVTELTGADFETVWVVGHADRIGTVEYNQGLSERRASAVKAFLVKLGIADDKISTSGRSELMPVTADYECEGMRGNALIECFQPDRRVEVSVSAEVVQEVMN